MKVIATLIIVATMAIIPTSALADERASDQQLINSCLSLTSNQAQAKVSLCQYYIQGFLASIDLANNSLASKQRNNKTKYSSFTQRAYQMRVNNQASTDQLSGFEQICLPEDKSASFITINIFKQLGNKITTRKMLNQQIFQELSKQYPCE